MFHVLIDTCVWLDLAQDPKQTPMLRVLEDFLDNDGLVLIVPRVVQVEFEKNRDRIAKTSARSLTSASARSHSAGADRTSPASTSCCSRPRAN